MYEVSKCSPQESLRDLDQAYKNFYRNLKEQKQKKVPKSKRIGLPVFKKKGKHDSFTLTGAIKVNSHGIQLPRLGYLPTKESTGKCRGRILAATVSREADRWYCSLQVKVVRAYPVPIMGDIVGIDLGLDTFATIYNGGKFDKCYAPKPLKRKLKKLKRVSRQQSKIRKGSANRKKANLCLARCHQQIKHIRQDFLHQLTTSLAKTKSVTIVEDLAVRNMTQNRRLARSIADVGWGEFRRQLVYKTAWYGARLIFIPRFEPTSKMCHVCGAVNKELELSDRQWICQSCGTVHDRDENAAVNIRNKGLEILHTESSSGINAMEWMSDFRTGSNPQ
jgi:putative transposase